MDYESYNALKLTETAREHNIHADVIFHDSTLRDIAKARPSSLADLRGVNGVGKKIRHVGCADY